MIKNISGVILSGGKNTRFGGKNKAFLEVSEGQTIIERTMGVIQAIFEDVIIISNEPESYKRFEKISIYPDMIKEIGPLGGIHSALANSKKDSVFVVAADMPFVSVKSIMETIKKYEQSKGHIMVPKTPAGVEPLHAVYGKQVFGKLDGYLKSGEDFSVRGFLSQSDTHYYNPSDEHLLSNSFSNINNDEDYRKMIKNG